MKNINTPIAILIGALIIAVAAIIIGTKDPLAKCMDKIIKDDVVLHKMFGIGKVLEVNNLYKISVFFADEGPKLLDLKYAKLKILSGEEACHPVLDNLENPEK